jgi:hypothetical protein
MSKLETKSEELEIEIIYGEPTILVDNPWFLALVQNLRNFSAVVPMTSFLVEETDPGSFDYQFTAEDGREWKQVMKIDGADPEMNFAIDDFWKLSEVQYQDIIYSIVTNLVNEYQATKIEVTWV